MWPPSESSTSKIAIAFLAGIFLFWVQPAASAQKRVTVPQSFQVRVINEGRPKAGILVTVHQGRPPQLGPVIRSEVTDRSGQAAISNIPPGDYTVRTGEWDRNDSTIVSVTRGNPSTKLISLRWPNLSMQHVRELRGTIHERDVRITAFALRSGDRVGSVKTDAGGRFAIPNASKGEFLLRLFEEGPKTSLQIRGDMGVVVDKSAPVEEIDVFLEMQRGFLTYGSFCHLPMNFKITHLCGQVVDEHGTSLSGIRVSYRDSHGNRHSIITDGSGIFDVKDSSPTETFLEISGSGYIPLRASGLRKGTEMTCQRPMRITLPKEETGYGCRSVKGID
jgi:hypothetical protein